MKKPYNSNYEYCTTQNKPLPTKFEEFLNPQDLKTLTQTPLADDQSKPSYEQSQPAKM